MIVTLTEEHLDKAIENKNGNICDTCIFTQAIQEHLGYDVHTSYEVVLSGRLGSKNVKTIYSFTDPENIMYKFDSERYDEVRAVLPIQIELTPNV